MVALKDGKEITFDLYCFTFDEYRDSFKDDKKQDALIAKACGMSVEKFKKLAFPDNRRIVNAFFKLCTDILKDPNSDGAPSSA